MVAGNWLLVLLLTAAAQQIPDGYASSQEKHLSEAVSQISAGHPEQAIAEHLDPALAAYGEHYGGEERQLYCAADSNETILYMGKAAVAKRSAVAIEPGWCTALFLKGYALAELGKLAEGAASLEQAVAMAPFNAHYLNELAYAYQQQHAWAKSIETYAHAAEAAGLVSETRDEERARAWRGQAYDLVELGRPDEAVALYRQCLALNPDDARAQRELDWILSQRPSS